MSKPLKPERAAAIGERIKELSRETERAGQKAAGEALRGSDLPFEKGADGRQVATIPTPDGGSVGISYDPATPPESDFGFSVRDPQGAPRNVSGVPGMQHGEASLKPMEVAPAIEKASGLGAAQLIARFGLDAATGGRSQG